ncbi:glycosyltransferase family 2 protein [Ottowia sp.]|uniref:glycosyltransferase family 2 protein n=1 Tax=Ottowia sp. TaxID=1898956 RepID=UPI003A86CAC0
MNPPQPRIALVVPCYNEAVAIGTVLDEYKAAWPEMALHVFDNNSTDGTADVARAHGAQVTQVQFQGKGNVVRRMLADVDADVYVMVDGDATYDASALREHVNLLITENLDMVLGQRIDDHAEADTNYRRGHRLGNRALTGTVMWIFGGSFADMLSGYRVFSRRFAKSFAAHAHGFETETELTVHALEQRMPCREVPVTYRSRPDGSVSKLSTYRDGWRILRTIVKLTSTERPLTFFGMIAALLALVSVGIAIPLFSTYFATGLVPRMPTAMLSTGLMLSAMLSMLCGVLLHQVTLARREAKHLAYLQVPPPGALRKPT